jgi:hypothetical protein
MRTTESRSISKAPPGSGSTPRPRRSGADTVTRVSGGRPAPSFQVRPSASGCTAAKPASTASQVGKAKAL